MRPVYDSAKRQGYEVWNITQEEFDEGLERRDFTVAVPMLNFKDFVLFAFECKTVLIGQAV